MPKDMTNKSTMWSGTQFNIEAFAAQQNAAAQQRWTCLGQLEECPETKRPHYQFAIKTPHIRMSQVVKMFPGAHIEVCRNKEALEKYVNKADTRIGALPQVSNLYPTLDATLTMFAEWSCSRWHVYDSDGQRQRLSGERWLDLFDEWVDTEAIPKQRLRVETLAANPQTRTAVKRYMNGIYGRYIVERDAKRRLAEIDGLDGQTDRQTAENNISPKGINDGELSSSGTDTEEEVESWEDSTQSSEGFESQTDTCSDDSNSTSSE